jgi:precorrin-2 dehydrogenase/sirohydrochlorin ferrochelatase
MSALFPAFVKLSGRRCLVIGGDDAAQSKIEGLLAAGAIVQVVAQRATPAIHGLASAGRISLEQRAFAAADLEAIFLVIATTRDPELNQLIFTAARRYGALCNVLDDPEHCDFYYPAVVRRGDLQIAISTAGHSPALAQRLRRELEERFGDDYSAWLQFLGAARKRLFAMRLDPERRRRFLHRLASHRAFQAFARKFHLEAAREG